jgi:hypothetical protein
MTMRIVERYEADGRRIESGFVDGPPRLTLERVIAMTDAELVATIVASADPKRKSLWPNMLLAATELERRAAAREEVR